MAEKASIHLLYILCTYHYRISIHFIVLSQHDIHKITKNREKNSNNVLKHCFNEQKPTVTMKSHSGPRVTKRPM